MKSLYSLLNARFGRPVSLEDRRRALKITLAASAGLLLSGPAYAFSRRAGKRVVVVGGGFSGLACGHELSAAGYDVTVLEARNRLGGRILSFKDFINGRNIEGGGELIGSNHPAWVAYAKKFDLEFLDVSEDEGLDLPIVLNGKLLSMEDSKKLWDDLEAAHAFMNEDAKAVDEDEPWKTPNAAVLDRRSLKDWIDGLQVSDTCKIGLAIENAANNGQAVDKQSYLGQLAQIKGGGIEKYWTDSEVYRCKGGNQQLAFKLAETLKDRVILGLPVTAIAPKGDGAVVTCKDGRTLECDDVVLAIPPTTWKKIDLKGGIPGALSPQMGINVKYLSHVKRRFWADKKLSQYGLTDADVAMTWDGTDGQEGDAPACLSVFAGGPAAERARARDADGRKAEYAKELEMLFPGYGENVVDTRFMDWPSEQWTGAGYSFPAPGQVTTVGPLLARGLGRIHFAGEHCCYKFVGYMEGALQSGIAVAKRLSTRDGLVKPEAPRPAAPAKQPAGA
ncbi:MAG TPA: NAD(P)/FAD-dependent oxidoreductase [Gemmataceae bacterium]|nr:NAD(P)/FAD-dependent oxidoreductase [Gemmataceae bacterium]